MGGFRLLVSAVSLLHLEAGVANESVVTFFLYTLRFFYSDLETNLLVRFTCSTFGKGRGWGGFGRYMKHQHYLPIDFKTD